MTNDAHSGSRWEPEHRRDETAELPTAAQPPAEQAVPPVLPPVGGNTAFPIWSGAAAVPPPLARNKKKRPLAALTAAGLVLVGGTGGWAIASAVVSDGNPAVEQTRTDDGAGTPDGVAVPPGAGQRPDSDSDGAPNFGGDGGRPAVGGDDGFVPPDGSTDIGDGDGGPADAGDPT